MGFSMRQCVCSVLAAGAAVLLYFLLKPYFGTETLSWLCILGALPFALLGFVNYNKMNAEQLLCAWVKSELLTPKKLRYIPTNYLYLAVRDSIIAKRKEALKRHGNKDTKAKGES